MALGSILTRAVRVLAMAVAVVSVLVVVLTLLYTIVTPVSTPMLVRMVTGQPVVRDAVALDQVAGMVPRLVIASEDGQFCRHWGVDWRELISVIQDEDGPGRGASTLSMQVARNLFLWGGDRGITAMVRKALEIPLALLIDLIWSKRRMMEIYLSIAEWGPNGEFGIEAGARRAFGKGAAGLSTAEAALLVAILPNPKLRDARAPSQAVRRKALLITRRAGQVQADCLR